MHNDRVSTQVTETQPRLAKCGGEGQSLRLHSNDAHLFRETRIITEPNTYRKGRAVLATETGVITDRNTYRKGRAVLATETGIITDRNT